MVLNEVEDICIVKGLGRPLRLCWGYNHVCRNRDRMELKLIVHTNLPNLANVRTYCTIVLFY